MKKIYQSLVVLMLSMGGATLTSCNDFLDVQPLGHLDEDKQFSNVQGFRDAMYGIYGQMASTDLYGREMSYGTVDILGQLFGYNDTNQDYNKISNYDYKDATVQQAIDKLWTSQYKVISDLNNVLKHLNSTNLQSSEFALMKGECLGLRAFLHFDMARLYAEDYLRSTSETRGIPYSTTFDLENKPVYTLHKVFELMLNDLNEAEKLLANDDEVNVESQLSTDYTKGRAIFFNKYAVAATKARIYYAMGDNVNAAKYAEQVIKATHNFELKKLTSMTDVKRYPANSELIFGHYNEKLGEDIVNRFLANNETGHYMEARRDLANLYEASSFTASNADIRYSAYYRQYTTTNRPFAFTRLVENEEEQFTKPLKGVTLIRLPEMYYILSESLYESDKPRAISLLNDVRRSRGLESVADTKVNTLANFKQEMLRERMREMPGEGQVFYALKHYNVSFKNYLGITTFQPSSTIFVLPWPEKELEFGNK
ncbi:MAG: RagB/SusD family nutrient uptake outer membrane protein [Prevotella sp.]|nr:RagB/SusD family nutrient uptake outer membrane protein [Prevotella sp.]